MLFALITFPVVVVLGFVTALFFASLQRFQDRLRARNFFISDTPSLVFFSACASFSFNPPAFVLSAIPAPTASSAR